MYRLTRLTLFLLFCCCNTIQAKGEELLVTVKSTAEQSIELLSDALTIPSITQEQFNQGYLVARKAIKIRYSSNVPWRLTICTPDSDLGSLGGNTKPLSDLLWKRSGQNDSKYQEISQSATKIRQSNRSASGKRTNLDLKLLLDWSNDAPGSYEVDLILSIGTRP